MKDDYAPDRPLGPPPMSPPTHSRGRCWARWALVLLLPIVLYGGLLTYDAWRPLTEDERRLVGTWIENPELAIRRTEMTFTADRRLEMTMIQHKGIRIPLGPGSWSIRGNYLRFRLDRRPDQTPATVRSWSDILSFVARPFSRFTDSAPIVFQGEDRMDWGDARYVRAYED